MAEARSKGVQGGISPRLLDWEVWEIRILLHEDPASSGVDALRRKYLRAARFCRRNKLWTILRHCQVRLAALRELRREEGT